MRTIIGQLDPEDFKWDPRILSDGHFVAWSADLHAALDGTFGPGRWCVENWEPLPVSVRDFIRQHARDWVDMTVAAEGRSP